MGKLLISNNRQWVKKLDDMFQKSGFQQSGKYEGSIYVKAYHKLNVDNVNYIAISNGFVASTGTLFYKNLACEEALHEIAKDIEEGKPEDELYSQCKGMFCVMYLCDNKFSLFIDAMGTYNIYYLDSSESIMITNTYYHIESCVKKELKEMVFLESISQESEIIDNETPFEDIYRLSGNERICIDLEKNTAEIEKINLKAYHLEANDIEGQINELRDHFVKYGELEKNIPYQPYRFCTGGVDTRLYLANDIASGQKPILCNWQGGPIDMNNRMEDREITSVLAERLNLGKMDLDISHDVIADIDKLQKEHFDKYGELGVHYSGNPEWYHMLDSHKEMKNYKIALWGENMRYLEILGEDEKDEYTLKEYVKLNLLGVEKLVMPSTYDGFKKYLNCIYKKFEIKANDRNYDIEHMSPASLKVLHAYYQYCRESRIGNILNMYGYHTNIFTESEMMSYFMDIPYKYKKHEYLALELIKRLDVGLLDIPFFSRARNLVYNKSENKLHETLNIRMRQRVRKILQKNSIGRGILSFRHRNDTKQDMNVRNAYVESINKLGFYGEKDEGVRLTITADSYKYFPRYVLALSFPKVIMFARE